MEIELHIEELETERRANRLQWFDNAGLEGIVGRFLSFRDDNTFVWLRAFSAPLPDQNFVRRETTIHLTPTIGSTIHELSDFARISEPVIELRQYRIAKGQRDRFATFLRDRTLDAQLRLGMTVHGPFNAAEDDEVLVWFRGFPSLEERDRRKAAFYQGHYWLNELEEEAFSMIEDYSNVILLTPASAP